jgi:uncharacterized protein (TIGR03435 family)
MASQTPTRKVVLAGAGALALALALAQARPSPQAAPLAFYAASIKPGEMPTGGRGMPPGGMPLGAAARIARFNRLQFSAGRVSGKNVTAWRLILEAYRLPQTQLEGGPDWLESDLFDVEANSEGPANELQLREMLQTLLAERFKLATHRYTKQMPVEALTVRKGGSKLQEWKKGQPMPAMFKKKGTVGVYLSHGTMQQFAEELSHDPQLYRPVVDRTGLSGDYILYLEWPDGGSKLTALRDIGLQLRSQRAPVDVLVVDRIEQPDEN